MLHSIKNLLAYTHLSSCLPEKFIYENKYGPTGGKKIKLPMRREYALQSVGSWNGIDY